MKIGLGLGLGTNQPSLGAGNGLPAAFVFADMENGQYFIGEDEVSISDIFVVNTDWGGPSPPYTLGAGGATYIDGKLSSSIMTEIIAQGCTIIVDVTTVGASGPDNINFGLLDMPNNNSVLQAVFGINGITVYKYSGTYVGSDEKLVNDFRNKLALVTVPGTRIAIAVNGSLDGSLAQGAAGTPPTDYVFFSSVGKFITNSLTIYLGNLTNQQIEDLT